jgi:PadR family transcriptional regulator, regulatory protein PadR
MTNNDSNPEDSGINPEDQCEFDLKSLRRTDKKMMRGIMRGVGKIMILWLISKKRQHGYEIMTQIHESSPYSHKMPSASMIYPVLHTLEKKGLIKGTWEHHGKKKVKYYQITEEGEGSLDRIRKLASENAAKSGEKNIWKAFMEDMFSLKTK